MKSKYKNHFSKKQRSAANATLLSQWKPG